MDTRRINSSGTYEWPNEVLPGLAGSDRLMSSDLEFIGCSDDCNETNHDTVYWPVEVSSAVTPTKRLPATCEMAFLSTGDLQEVYVTISQNKKTLLYRKALNRGYYPAARPLRISLDELGIIPLSPGQAQLQVSAGDSSFYGTINVPEGCWIHNGNHQ